VNSVGTFSQEGYDRDQTTTDADTVLMSAATFAMAARKTPPGRQIRTAKVSQREALYTMVPNENQARIR
jgi:hypothetical protein